MSYETKAGVAVSCSFLCLVGVVLSSKLWDGQAANAGTNPPEVENKESVGNGIQTLTGVGAANPKLQTPPTDLQLVKGSGAAPQGKVGELFKDDDDPFQATPYPSDDAPPPNAIGASTNPSPGFKVPDAGSSPVLPVESQPKTTLASGPGTTPPANDIKKPAEPSLDEIMKQMKAGSNTPQADTQKSNPTLAAVPPTAAPAPAPMKSLAEMVEEAEKQKKAAEAQVANATQKGSAAADNFRQDAAALGGNALQKSGAAADNITAELAKQKNIAQTNMMDMGAGKGALLSGETGIGGSKQPIGAAVTIPTMGAGLAGAAKDAVIPNGIGGNAAPAPNFNGSNVQPPFPAAGSDGSPGQPDLITPVAGSRNNTPASLGSPAVSGNTPYPNNQYAQSGNGGMAAPANPETPAFGSRPEARVQPIIASAPITPVASQKDHWDDDLYFGQASDSYKTIAKDKYQSVRFADALMYYNRDHLLATEATRNNPETIVQGQRIYLPPIRILKREYSSAILEESDVAAPRSAPPTTRPATTGGTPAAPLPEKTYRVRGTGESFYTIARNTLGNGLRWSEIYNLNTRFDPTVEVPGGTVLRMPGEAKIDAADAASKP